MLSIFSVGFGLNLGNWTAPSLTGNKICHVIYAGICTRLKCVSLLTISRVHTFPTF